MGPEKIQRYYALKPAIEFPSLNRLEWATTPIIPTPGCTCDLALHLSKSPDGGARRELVLEFENVTEVQFNPALKCVVLEIRDVSARQWDSVKYEVRDSENQTLSFFCRDFSFSVRDVIP